MSRRHPLGNNRQLDPQEEDYEGTEPEMDDENTSVLSSLENVIQLQDDDASLNNIGQDDNDGEEEGETAAGGGGEQEVVVSDENSQEQEAKPVTPLPKLAMVMISLIIIAEAVGFSILFPVVPFMVRDFLLFEQQEAHHLNNGTLNYNVSSSVMLSSSSLHDMKHDFNNFAILPTSFTFVTRQLFDSNLLGIMMSNDSIIRNNGTAVIDELEIPEERVGLLVGILASAFSVAQLISNWFISRASDHLGRKPFLISGLIVNVIFLGLFSFSKNFWFALVVRTVHGAFNANVPIYKSFVVDVTDDTNQEKAFVIISILWAISNVVSPGLGGWLSKPAEKWPFLFGGKDNWFYNFFYINPYVLPLSVPIIMNIISILFSSIFMKESLRNRFDIVNWLLVKIGVRREKIVEEEIEESSIEMMSASMTNLDAYSTRDNLLEEENNSSRVEEIASVENIKSANKDKTGSSLLFLLKDSLVVRVAMLYLLLGLATNIMDEMVPIFSSNSISKRGLSLDSSQIGLMLSIGGITSLVMLIIYPKLSDKLGFLWLYRIALIIYVVDVVAFPFSTELVKYELNPWLVFTFATFCIFIKACSQEMAYTSQFLLVNNSAPNPENIGSVMGIAHITASVGWASGPFIGGVLLNVGLNWADSLAESYPDSWIGKVPLVDKISFWVCGGVCVLTFILSLTIPKSILNRRYENVEEKKDVAKTV